MTSATHPLDETPHEPGAPATGTPAADAFAEEPAHASRFLAWLRLQAALSGVALVVVALRSLQIERTMTYSGVAAPWGPIIATQAAFWVAWSLWAGVLVHVVKRLVDRPTSRAAGIGRLAALTLLPAILVPLAYAPIHWIAFDRPAPLPHAFMHQGGRDLVTNVLLSATIVGVVYGWFSLQRARRLEVAAARLGERLTRSQLDALRAQLDPHFLFNALNSVAVLARRGRTAEVEQMVTRLADLLRHSLDTREQLVPLRVELEALRQYLGIEQVRFGERLVASIEVEESLEARAVPSFVLQPLVENAIRHGFADGRQVLHVRVAARGGDDGLVLEVSDDGAGLAGAQEVREGLGLANTRARLRGLYGEAASLVLAPAAGGRGTVATVGLPRERVRGVEG